ncbi:hypothetical protein ACJX0J_022301, partial [Zea mays]
SAGVPSSLLRCLTEVHAVKIEAEAQCETLLNSSRLFMFYLRWAGARVCLVLAHITLNRVLLVLLERKQ